MESCDYDCRAANGEVFDVPAEVTVPFFDVPSMQDFAILLKRDADWTQVVDSVEARLLRQGESVEAGWLP